jgi:hypothetical protein
MIELLLAVVLVVGIAALAVAMSTLRSSQRSEKLGEDRYEMLVDQRDRLELLREERQMLLEELKRESQQRQRFVENIRPQAAKDLEQGWHRLEQERRQLEEQLEQERQAREETARRAEQQEGDEQSRIEQHAERVAQDLQQLRGDLEREREERLEAQRLAEQLGQERRRLERELNRSKGGSLSQRPAASPWWRKPTRVVVVLLGSLIVWLTSLVVALQILNP